MATNGHSLHLKWSLSAKLCCGCARLMWTITAEMRNERRGRRSKHVRRGSALQIQGFFICSAFIDYIKGRFEAIKDIYSPYQIKLHLSSLCCVIVPLNSLHHTNSFSLAHEGSRWQRYGNTSFVPSLSFCVSSCLPSVVSLQLLHYSFNVSPFRLLLHHLPSFARVLMFSFCNP